MHFNTFTPLIAAFAAVATASPLDSRGQPRGSCCRVYSHVQARCLEIQGVNYPRPCLPLSSPPQGIYAAPTGCDIWEAEDKKCWEFDDGRQDGFDSRVYVIVRSLRTRNLLTELCYRLGNGSAPDTQATDLVDGSRVESNRAMEPAGGYADGYGNVVKKPRPEYQNGEIQGYEAGELPGHGIYGNRGGSGAPDIGKPPKA